ncbi:hypothetical protein B0H11DRAFT_2304229 [Mycena galericulata]|nr:hypothetical protein B0H11DRAFT_2304229 [Mycena galericulata]
MSFPHLFAAFEFTPYSTGSYGAPLLPSPTEVHRRLERLNFWCSSEIAPFVRYCNITARDSWIHRLGDPSGRSISTDSPYILLDALFERLMRFTGLQRLHAHQIHFTQASVDILCRLPHLSEIRVYWCTIAPEKRIEPSPQALHVSDFDLIHDDRIEYKDDHWIPLLHPDHLRALRVSFNPRSMAQILHTMPSFPNVYKLGATMKFPTAFQNVSILSKFPAVRILNLKLRGDGLLTNAPHAPASAVFPLQKYHGPYQPLPVLLAVASLTHLIISQCSPRDLITRIQCIQSHSIISFHVKFDNTFNNTVFKSLVGLLPQLKELLISIDVANSARLFKREVFDPRELDDDDVVEGRLGGDCVRVGFTVQSFLPRCIRFINPGIIIAIDILPRVCLRRLFPSARP